MSELIKKLSPNTEFIVIISLSFGYSILVSLLSLFGHSINITFTNTSLVSSIFYEIIIFITVTLILSMRDNHIEYQNNMSVVKLIWASILLFLAYYTIYFALYFLMNNFIAISSLSNFFSGSNSRGLNPILILAFSVVNPIYEEFIIVGYVIPTLSSRKSVSYAINVSVLIRFLYHLYQGPIAAISIIPMGLVFGLVFLKYRNVWMLVIAHGIMDFIALCMYGL